MSADNATGKTSLNLARILFKGLILFVAANILFAIWNPSGLGRFSLYNIIFPGRSRLPFGENPAQSYNLSLFNLDAMFASHQIASGQLPTGEYRVFLIGDSSIWGILLKPEDTLSGQLNSAGLFTCDGRKVQVYNLGYPTISLTKDLMILDQAMRYHPDLIIWSMTLEAFPASKQLTSPIVSYNAVRVQELIAKYDLSIDPNDPELVQNGFWGKTIISQRRNLADVFRLQMYGVLWAATGIDQVYPAVYPLAQTDFDADESFHDLTPPVLDEKDLAFGVVDAGLVAAGETPVLLVNEPILISAGLNSELRYNFLYPRWAYDQYRQMMFAYSARNQWDYLDLWDIVPADQYTNSAIHLTTAGESLLADRIGAAILERACP